MIAPWNDTTIIYFLEETIYLTQIEYSPLPINREWLNRIVA